MTPIQVPSDGGKKVNILGIPMVIRIHGRDTGGVVSAVESHDVLGGGPPPHIHHREDETFQVLEGEYEWTVGDKTFVAKKGATIFAPRGIPHTYRYLGQAPGRLMCVITPAGFEEFFEAIAVLTPQQQQDIPRVISIAKQFGLEILPPPKMRANALNHYLLVALGLRLTAVFMGGRCLAGVCPYGTTLPGIDVSHYQGTINWASVRTAGMVFAYAKATEGITYTDPLFTNNWSGMKAAGVVRGAYLFFHSNDDPIAEADHYLSVVGTIEPGDLPPMLDVEVTDSQTPAVIAATLNSCAARLQAVTGRVPVIYTSPSFWTGSIGSTGFSGSPLWVANWGVTCPSMPVGWTNWAIWQYSSTGTVGGITGAVDLDEFNGTTSDMLAFTGLPSLSIALNGPNQVALTWSRFAAGFVLQQNADLTSTNWANVTNAPVVMNNQQQVIVGTTGDGAFFRLVHP